MSRKTQLTLTDRQHAYLIGESIRTGLSMAELDRLERLIRRICELGATIVIVEHHLDLVANIASHVMVLDRGTVLAAGKPADVFNDARVMRAYMGERALKAGAPA